MNLLVPIGRVLFALIFLAAAPRHFTEEGIQHAADFGVPLAKLLVPASGVLAIVSSLSVMTGFKAEWGAWGLVLFLVPITFSLHAFWNVSDPVQHHVQQAMFAKNISMIGAALLLAHFGAGPYAISASLPSAQSGSRQGPAQTQSTARDQASSR